MEESITPIRNVHIDHSILMESINKLNGDALQNFQDAIMGYVNHYYGNFIEENLRTDPQFRHLFGNKISGKPVPSGKNNPEAKKLLDKVEGKSKMIRKTSKTLFENVAHVKDISGNNLGSVFFKKNLKLSKCINENQKVYKKLSSIVPDQNNNIQCGDNNSNQRIFFILKPQIENPIKGSNNLSDKDMHSRDSNENIQQNEIYFLNSDYNEKNCDKNLSSTFCNLDNQKEVQKSQKNTMICKNKRKLGTENNRNHLKANTKKKMRRQSAFEIEKYLRTEELKKIERYKYNSGGHLKFCKNSLKKKCIYNFEGKEKNESVQNIQFTDKKYIPLKLCKLDLKRDSTLSDVEKSIDSETKVVVESTLNNFSLENEVSSRVDCKTNGISEVGKGLISQKIKEHNNVERSVDIVQTSKIGNIICSDNEDIQKSKPHRKQIIVDSLKIKNCMDRIHIFNSTSSLERIGLPQKNDTSIENDKLFKNNAIRMVDKSGKGIEAITKEEYIEKNVEIDGQGLEKVTVNKEQNVSVECIHCNLNFSEISPRNLVKQIKTEHIRNNNIEKSVKVVIDVVSPEVMSFNMKDSNHINSKKFSNVHDNKVSSRKDIISQGSSESSSNSTKTSREQNDYNSYVGPMKKYSSDPYAAEPITQLKHKMEMCEYSLLGVADEKTNEFGVITLSRKDLNELKTNCDLNLGTICNTNLELDYKQFENIQQNVNSVTYKIEEVSSIQLKKETITHLDQPETKNSPGLLKNTLKANIENKLSLNEMSIRRSSLRNKTGTMHKKDDVENHMLVKITYDKGNFKKNNVLCKEQTVFDAKVNERSSRNGDTKENIDNGQTKANFSYNLRSSFMKENTKILKKKN